MSSLGWGRLSTAQGISVAVVSLILAVCVVAGEALEANDSAFGQNKVILIGLALSVVLRWIVYGLALWLIYAALDKWRGWANQDPAGIWAFSPWARWAAIAGLLAICWLPYWFFLWPGVTSTDSWTQIIQAVGARPYWAHHPLAHTLMIGGPFRFFLWMTGNATVAVSMVTLTQLVALALVIAYCLSLLAALPVSNRLRWGALALFALNPIIGWHAVTLWKDIWLATAVLLFATLGVTILWRTRQNIPVGFGWWVALTLAGAAIPLMKKTGVYVLVIGLVAFCILARRSWRSALISSVVALGLGVGINAGLAGVLHSSPGQSQEIFSAPSQQIARVVRDHPEVLSAADVDLLDRYYPGVNLGQLYGYRYNQQVADATKNSLANDQVKADPQGYFRLWSSLCGKSPGTCVAALAASSLGYWYPGPIDYRLVVAQDWPQIYADQIASIPGWEEPLGGGVEMVSERMHDIRQTTSDVITSDLSRVPVFAWLLLPGAWTWATVLVAVAAAFRRQSLAGLSLSLAVVTVATCFVSPVYGEVRYALPVLFLLPLSFATTFLPPRLAKGAEVATSSGTLSIQEEKANA